MNTFAKNSAFFAACLLMVSGCKESVEMDCMPNQNEVRITAEFIHPSFEGNTRTELSENSEGNLDCVWSAGDKVTVTTPDGSRVGELTLMSGEAGKQSGKFEGSLTGVSDGDHILKFFYLGKNKNNITVSSNASFDISSQDGTVASFGNNDCLMSEGNVSVADGSGYIADMGLERKFAFGRFKFVFQGNVNAEGSVVTVSGANVCGNATLSFGNASLTMTESPIEVKVGKNNEFYMTVFPKQGITPEFTVKVGDKSYKGSLPARDWKSNEYVRAEISDGGFSGIEIDMIEIGGEKPKINDTVGPVITINGKKYKFTRGNLWYNVDTGEYGIFEKQTYYLYQFGKGVINKPQTYGSAYLGYDKIDMFSWGATGIGDYTQNPQTICKVGGTDNENYTGTHYPFVDESALSNSSFTNLLKPVSMDLWEADFGYAYMVSGRAKSDARQYITPPLDAFNQAFNNTKNVIQGCTVKGAGMNGENVTGIIVIPDMTIAQVKEKLKSDEMKGCAYTSSLDLLNHNNGGNTFNVTAITLRNYDDIKLLNNALFLPAAGNGNPSSEKERKGYTSFSKTPGCYWSADGNQGSSTTANGKRVYFSDKVGFFYNGGSNNSSYSRHGKMSIRLLVEVEE